MQAEADIVRNVAADERHAADQDEDVVRAACQQQCRAWGHRGLLAAAVMAGTALGALRAAAGGRRGRR